MPLGRAPRSSCRRRSCPSARARRSSGRATAVTAEALEEIQAFGLGVARWDLTRLAGWALFSALLVGLLLAWVWRFRPELWHRTNALALVGLLLVIATFALELTAGRPGLPFIVPTAAVGILVALLLDAGAAMLLIAVIAVVAGAVNGGAVNGGSLEMTAYVFFGGAAGIVAIRRGDRLNAFVQAGVAIALVDALVVTTFGLLGELDLTGVIQLWGASAAAGVGAAVVAVGTFAVLGNVFGILTAFQLLELANPSQPLLRRLLMETPGTYHHSIMVANLAERAAEAIGADPLLTRVAAYYHDVGKLANPLAFIENQAGGDNIHDELDPETSGPGPQEPRRRRDRHRLPGAPAQAAHRVHPAAPRDGAHQLLLRQGARAGGRAVRRAVDVRRREGGQRASTSGRYRHAGPKPQTREAALIMLADGVEASVRSLASRDEPAIRAMVSRIIEERLERRPVRRVRPDPARRRADPRGVRRPAPRHVPPADRLPAEQDRRARVASGGDRRRLDGGGRPGVRNVRRTGRPGGRRWLTVARRSTSRRGGST